MHAWDLSVWQRCEGGTLQQTCMALSMYLPCLKLLTLMRCKPVMSMFVISTEWLQISRYMVACMGGLDLSACFHRGIYSMQQLGVYIACIACCAGGPSRSINPIFISPGSWG